MKEHKEPHKVQCSDMFQLVRDEIDRLRKENARLKERLEIDDSGYDGIACRDETIRQLELQLILQSAKFNALKEILEVKAQSKPGSGNDARRGE